MSAAWCLRLAALSGFLVVALGAFGAHSLKPLLQSHQTLEIWEKAVLYHAVHTLVLVGLAAQPSVALGTVVGFLAGIVVFSGSLYVLAVTNIRWLGAITPLGGSASWSAGRGCSSPPGPKARDKRVCAAS